MKKINRYIDQYKWVKFSIQLKCSLRAFYDFDEYNRQ